MNQGEFHLRKTFKAGNSSFSVQMDLQIHQGEIVAFFGPSGVGKTTLLRMIAGLCIPDEGSIIVGNEVWFDSVAGIFLPPRFRRIGYVVQDHALFPNLTVRGNLRFAQPGTNRQRLDEVIRLFDLNGLESLKPSMLSGGQQQRVALARAVIREPRFLLLDEPFSALDQSRRLELQQLIRQIHRQLDITVLLVSHDLPGIFHLCSRIVVLKQGKIVRQGTPREVFGQSGRQDRFPVVGEILQKECHDDQVILTILIDLWPVQLTFSAEEAGNYRIGDQLILSAPSIQASIRPPGERKSIEPAFLRQ